MKRATFIQAIEKYHERVVAALLRSEVDPDLAHDAAQEMFAALLKNKSYHTIEYEALDNRIFSFFKRSAKSRVKDVMVEQQRDNQTFVTIDSETEKEREEKVDMREREQEDWMCPYCFTIIHADEMTLDRLELSIRTQCKACDTCGTILGRGKSVREHFSVDEADLASLPDLDKSLDVFNAVAALEPLEQKVIKAIAEGTETLNDMADLLGRSRSDLARIYVRAKKKLQLSLLEYAV